MMTSAFCAMLTRVQLSEPGQRPGAAFFARTSGSSSTRLHQPEEALVGDVVLQHIEDEALLDGLPHRVEVERRGCPVGPGSSKTASGLELRRGGEGEEAEVGLPRPRSASPADRRRVRPPRISVVVFLVAEYSAASFSDTVRVQDAFERHRRVSPDCELCASSTITANCLPAVASVTPSPFFSSVRMLG